MSRKMFYTAVFLCILVIGVIFLVSFLSLEEVRMTEDLPFPAGETDNAVAIAGEILNTVRSELVNLEHEQKEEVEALLRRLEFAKERAADLRKRSQRDPSLLNSREYLLELEGLFEKLSSILDEIIPKHDSRKGQEAEL